MRHKLIALIAAMFTLSGPLDAGIDFSSELTLDKRFVIDDGVPVFPLFNKFLLMMKAPQTRHLGAYTSLDFRFYDFPTSTFFEDISDPSKQNPYDLLLWESYIDLFEVVPGLELRVGKQRINWGRADMFNPTDNLNPDDFSDITNFGEKVPTFAVNAKYYFFLGDNEYKLQYVWLPSVRTVLLPRYINLPVTDAMFDQQAMMAEMAAGMPEDQQKLAAEMNFADPTNIAMNNPPYDGKHSMHAARLGGMIGPVDFSLSYMYGYDDLPVPSALKITKFDLAEKMIESDVETTFARQHVIGADTAFELFSIGFRGEVAVFMPERVEMTIKAAPPANEDAVDLQPLLDTMLGENPTITGMKDDIYVKYTAGFDYTFKFGTYVNFQYTHGFITERGENLNDYFFLRMEHSFFDESLLLTLNGGFVTDGFQDISSQYAYLVMPEVTFKFFKNVDIALGGFIVEGEGDSFLLIMDDFDQVYFRVKGYF